MLLTYSSVCRREQSRSSCIKPLWDDVTAEPAMCSPMHRGVIRQPQRFASCRFNASAPIFLFLLAFLGIKLRKYNFDVYNTKIPRRKRAGCRHSAMGLALERASDHRNPSPRRRRPCRRRRRLARSSARATASPPARSPAPTLRKRNRALLPAARSSRTAPARSRYRA